MSIGEALAAARRQAGLSVTQVSQRTRIRETIIRGIERDDFYARGHIRAIAKAAGAEPLVAEYDSSHGTPPASAVADLPGTFTPIRLGRRRTPNWRILLLVVLAAAVGLVAFYLLASQAR